MDILPNGPFSHVLTFLNIKELIIFGKVNTKIKKRMHTYGFQLHFRRADLINQHITQRVFRELLYKKYKCHCCSMFSISIERQPVIFGGDVVLRFCAKCIDNNCGKCSKCNMVRPNWFLESRGRYWSDGHVCNDKNCLDGNTLLLGHKESKQDIIHIEGPMYNPMLLVGRTSKFGNPTVIRSSYFLSQNYHIVEYFDVFIQKLKLFEDPLREATFVLDIYRKRLTTPYLDENYVKELLIKHATGPIDNAVLSSLPY